MKISLALHIISLIMWLGSLLILTRCMKIFTQSYPTEAETGMAGFRKTMKKMFFGITLPGAGIALITGLYQFSLAGAGYYMKLGWFHTKLTLVLILFVITFMSLGEVKKIGNMQILSGKKALILHIAASLCMIAIVFLTILNR